MKSKEKLNHATMSRRTIWLKVCNTKLDTSFISFYHYDVHGECFYFLGFDYHQFFTGAHMNQQDRPEEDELDVPEVRLRYAMKPRPVNIHALKSVIQDFLQAELQLSVSFSYNCSIMNGTVVKFATCFKLSNKTSDFKFCRKK